MIVFCFYFDDEEIFCWGFNEKEVWGLKGVELFFFVRFYVENVYVYWLYSVVVWVLFVLGFWGFMLNRGVVLCLNLMIFGDFLDKGVGSGGGGGGGEWWCCCLWVCYGVVWLNKGCLGEVCCLFVFFYCCF